MKEERISKEFSQLISKPPSWTTKYGTTSVVIISIIFIALSAFISYNDIIESRILLTTKEPTVKIKSRINGELANIYVKHSDTVISEQILAELKNEAKLSDVLLISDKLNDLKEFKEFTIDSLSLIFPTNLRLGMIQESYNSFYTNYQDFLINDSLKPKEYETNLITNQISQKKLLLDNQRNELFQFGELLNISASQLQRQKTLFAKGVISESELEQSKSEHFTQQKSFRETKAKINQTKIELTALENKMMNSSVDTFKQNENTLEVLKQSVQNLKNKIETWEEKYILKSRTNGIVSFYDSYEKFQSVSIGERIFTIFPKMNSGIIGTLKIPVFNSGKVKKGQRVIIKLDNYPHYQYGSFEGKVLALSSSPESNTYTVFVDSIFLESSYNEKIIFNQEMLGNAEIVTEELSLLERALYSLRKVFSN